MKTQHTPGPWEFGGSGTEEMIHNRVEGKCIAIVNHSVRMWDGEATANARLIAAAPSAPHDCDDPDCPGAVNKRKLAAFSRMLDALKYVQDNIESPETIGQDPDRRDNAIRTVRYAIAKAESDPA